MRHAVVFQAVGAWLEKVVDTTPDLPFHAFQEILPRGCAGLELALAVEILDLADVLVLESAWSIVCDSVADRADSLHHHDAGCRGLVSVQQQVHSQDTVRLLDHVIQGGLVDQIESVAPRDHHSRLQAD